MCLFRPEARMLTNCGWLVLARMSAGELLFYFAESPLTFISLHLLRDGDPKWQGLLSLFLLCLYVCPFSPPRPHCFHLTPPVSSSFCLPQSSLQLWCMCIRTLATVATAQSKLNLVSWGTLKREMLSVRDVWRETAQDGTARVKKIKQPLRSFNYLNGRDWEGVCVVVSTVTFSLVNWLSSGTR